MKLNSIISETFGRGVYIGTRVDCQNDSWWLREWSWDRTKLQKNAYTHYIHNLAIF